jgi:hypothetical protein
MVLGLLLNDRGTVVRTQIIVPSKNPLSDIAAALGTVGQQWSPDIPLLPGEERWITWTLDYRIVNTPSPQNLP